MTDTNDTSASPPPPTAADAPLPADQAPTGRQVPLVLAEPKDRPPSEAQSNPLGLVLIFALFALLWFWAGPSYFWVVVGVVVMIFLHELGHFMTARWTGMKATQFFLFMGPRIWSFQRGETEYGVRALPLGAFVRIIGMHNLDPVEDPADEPRAYRNKSYPQRMLVITAGSMMHFIQAVLLFMVVTTAIGIDDPEKWSIGEISALETGETPAVVAGLEPGDTVTAVDGVATIDWRDLRTYVRDNPGEEVELTIVRGDETIIQTTTLASLVDENSGDDFGFLGVSPVFDHTRQNPLLAFETFGSVFWQSLTSIPQFLSPSTF
ncbi:MAG: site-2 protease family protein, partial [Actinomycetota bacterium]